VYVETDAALAEINPLVKLKSGDIVALDSKMTFDDNALFKHKDIVEMRDIAEEDEREAKAKEFDLAYISLHGNIGCMVNGAGLAMATMDTIKLVGGQPANFLDVGGGASKEKVTAAFKLILADPAVKAVLVNIFGGIMKCDVIAEGVVAAAKEVKLTVPLIVRLEGTNVELGKEILKKSGLAITPADNLRQAAEKAVAAIK
jgi:succinyl-CoA synthetase beta subunit